MGNLFGDKQSNDLDDEKLRVQLEHTLPFFGNSMTIQQIVEEIHNGNASSWQSAASGMGNLSGTHGNAAERGSEMLQALESAWSGAGADAARQRISVGRKAADAAADVYSTNQSFYQSNASAFDSVKQRLPKIPAEQPETGLWSTVTPWQTGAEKDLAEYNATVDRARETYSTHETATLQAGHDVDGSFVKLGEFGGDLGSFDRGGGDDGGTGLVDIEQERGGGGGGGSIPGGGGPVGGGSVSPIGGGSTGSISPTPSAVPNDSTGSSGLSPSTGTPPAANYPSGGIPGGPGYGPNNPGAPGGPGANSPGFGPVGGGGPRGSGFGPGGTPGGGAGGAGGAGRIGGGGAIPGGAAGAGSGAGAAGAAGGAGAGRMTGAGGFGPTGGGGAGAGGGAAGGAGAGAGGRGMMGGGMMGGGGAGRGGQGGGDEDHQRKYMVDTDEVFALTENGEVLRDPTTGRVVTPPTIGE